VGHRRSRPDPDQHACFHDKGGRCASGLLFADPRVDCLTHRAVTNDGERSAVGRLGTPTPLPAGVEVGWILEHRGDQLPGLFDPPCVGEQGTVTDQDAVWRRPSMWKQRCGR